MSDGVISSGNAAGGRRHELAAQARDALVDAGYLQSAMRAQVAYAKQRGDAPSALALRDTFIAADALTGEDNERSLRHRVESALLHWHEHIAEGRLQVGVMLWNLLGADDQGKDHAERWKTSLDRPAIIASLPGRPSDLVRQIPAAASAITPCGNWLVTSDGLSKTEIWDLRQGWHRAWLRWRLSWVLGPRIEAAAIGTELGVGGVDAQQHRDLVMGVVDLDTGQHDLARYVGHGAWVRTVSLKCHTDRQQVVWALGSGSDDHSVGLLLRTTKQIVNDSRTSGAAQGAPVSGVIARYAGHRAPVASVSLQAQYDGQRMVWALASGSFDHTVGLLLRTREQVVEDSRVSGAGHGVPVPGVLVRYAGHRSAVTSISLQAHYDGRRLSWVLGSGSHDFTVGLLLRTLEQINFEASKQARGEAINGALARYGGHVMNVNSVCLQGLSEGLCTTWVLASGSSDNTVGMLLRTSQQIEDDSRHSGADRVWPNGGTLARYVLRGGTGASVSLQCTHDGQRSICALACGSGNWGAHFGHLLVRTVQEIEQDARHSSEMERWTPNPGLEALFPLPRDVRGSLSLACKRRGQHIVWAVASLSELRPVGLIEMPRRQIDDGVRRSRESRDSTISPVLARYAGHGSRVRSVDLGCVQDGQAKVWALASGSDDSTVGLLIRTREQIGSDVLSSGADREVPNCGVLERYTGHSFEVASVSLRGHHDGEHVTWAVASGSYDGTVGLLLRPSEDSTANTRRTSAVRRFTTSMHNRRVVRKIISYARRWGLMRKQPKVGMLVRYGGHGDFVTAVSLDYQHNGEASMLAVASGTYGGSVGLLLRSLEQLQHDAQNSFAEDDTPNPGVLARYAGHGDTVRCVSIAGQHDGEQKVWALASGAVDCTVGVLLRTAEQIGEDSNRSTSEITVPNPCVLARQLAHSLPLGAVSLQFQRVGQQAVCAVASGSFDRTVGLLLRTPKQIGEEAAQAPEPHQSRHTLTRGTGLAECVSLRRIDWPCEALGIPQSKTAAYWLGGNAEALMIWSADLEATSRSNRADEGDHVASLPGLMPRLVCPLGAVDLEVMAFAGSPDGMEYAVGGAVGLDVAIMMLEVRLPEP